MPAHRHESRRLVAVRGLFLVTIRRTPRPTLFPYTTLFRSEGGREERRRLRHARGALGAAVQRIVESPIAELVATNTIPLTRSEEHTSELQSHVNLVCRLLLEKKKTRLPTRCQGSTRFSSCT